MKNSRQNTNDLRENLRRNLSKHEPPKRFPVVKEYTTFATAILALLLSAWNVYYANFNERYDVKVAPSPSFLTFRRGPEERIELVDRERHAITFANSGNRPVSIQALELTFAKSATEACQAFEALPWEGVLAFGALNVSAFVLKPGEIETKTFELNAPPLWDIFSVNFPLTCPP
jgi:hypothetical protein